MKKPLILTAMEMEGRAVEKQLAASGMAFGLLIVGIRACRLPATFEGASVILMAGLAGALDPGLKVGDIVLDDGKKLFTAEKLMCTPTAKAQLFRESGAVAVDMENAIVRRAAESAGVRFVGVRAISDCAVDAVDPELFTLVDEIGRVRPMAAAGLFLRRPGLIKQARELQKNSQIALDALGVAVLKFLQAEGTRSPSGRG